MTKEQIWRFYFNFFREKLHRRACIQSTHSGKTSKDRDKEKKNKEFHLQSKSWSILPSSDRWIMMVINDSKIIRLHTCICMESRPFHRVSRERFLFLFFKPEGVLEFGCVFFTCGWIRIECWKG